MANGQLRPGELISREDAIDVAEMLVATGRAISAAKWVEGLVARERTARIARLPHNLI